MFSWTGFYVGVNGGFGVGNRTATFNGNDNVTRDIACVGLPPLGPGTCPSPISDNLNGWVGGSQAGYNWQLNPHFVVGIETNFDSSAIRGDGTSRFQYPIFDIVRNNFFAEAANLQASEELKWFGTVVGRLGVVPTEKTLLFVTGGAAYGLVNQAMAVNLPNSAAVFGGDGFGYGCGNNGANCFIGNNNRLALGYTVGAGVEIALTNNITVKSEYSYVNLGEGQGTNVLAQSMIGGIGYTPASFTASSGRLDYHIVRFGLNFKSNP